MGDVVLEVVEVDLGALSEKKTRMKVKLDFAFFRAGRAIYQGVKVKGEKRSSGAMFQKGQTFGNSSETQVSTCSSLCVSFRAGPCESVEKKFSL